LVPSFDVDFEEVQLKYKKSLYHPKGISELGGSDFSTISGLDNPGKTGTP
jgi:hypothetical protein